MKSKLQQFSPAVLANLAPSGLGATDGDAMGLRPLSAEYCRTKYGVAAEAYVIPYRTLHGRVNGFARVRFVGPGAKGQRYHQIKKGCRLYLPPVPGVTWADVARERTITLYFTEGEKKAYAATRAGLLTIGLGGVENWRKQALAELDQFDLVGRIVILIFDSPDISTNPSVLRAMREFAAELRRRGADVRTVRLPEVPGLAKTGLDDFLVARGKAAFEALPEEPIDPPQHNTDQGNARRLLARHGADLRWAPGAHWLAWDGQRWRANESEVMRRAKDSAGAIYGEVARATDSDQKKALARWAATSESVTKLKAAIELARTEPGVELDVGKLDADPWLLGVQNGVVDLRTGKL
ncbi:MAG: DUF3854 domain-containing protein, partial [Burkholderiales bacterium]